MSEREKRARQMQRLTEEVWARDAEPAAAPDDSPTPSWLGPAPEVWFEEVILWKVTEAARDGRAESVFLLDSEMADGPTGLTRPEGGAELDLLGAALASLARDEGFEVAWWPSLNRTLRLRWVPRPVPPPTVPSVRPPRRKAER